jgi:hypothetical protein
MDITANLTTPEQLSNFMVQAIGTDRANQDQWCWALSQITKVAGACPAYDIGNGPNVLTSAEDFLIGLRNYQLSQNASTQSPGGGPAGDLLGIPPVQTSNATPLGAGLLGPTNCQFCIWLKKNPWALVLAAVAVYFGFFYKK